MKKQVSKTTILTLLLLLPFISIAQKEEGPSKQTIYDFTKNYITNSFSDGYFVLYDEVTNRKLHLTNATKIRYVKCPLGKERYYNCAEFKSKDGSLYDIDFFLKWNGDSLQMEHVILHKTNSKPRYVWDLDKKVGLWNALQTANVDSTIKWKGEDKYELTNIVYDEKTETKPVYVWFKDQETGKWLALIVDYKVDKDISKLYGANRKLKEDQ